MKYQCSLFTSRASDYDQPKCNPENSFRSMKNSDSSYSYKSRNIELVLLVVGKDFKIKNVSNGLKLELLINILGENVQNVLIFAGEEDMRHYGRLKT